MVPCGAECCRKIYVIATMVCRFFWHELMLWPEDMKRRAALVVLSGRDTLVPLRLIQARRVSVPGCRISGSQDLSVQLLSGRNMFVPPRCDTLVSLRLIQARLSLSTVENQNVLLQYLYFRAGGALRA